MIAFAKPAQGVFVANRDGSNSRQVSKAYGLDLAFTLPEWSPDGTRIAFMAGDQPGYSIVVANVDGSGETTVAQPASGKQVYWPSFSPDGTKLAYQRVIKTVDNNDSVNWVVANADGSNPRQLPVELSPSQGGWSPDGRFLIGYSWINDVQYVVLVDAASGSDQRVAVTGTDSASWQRLAP
jgi:Tol biopolymer transport system component